MTSDPTVELFPADSCVKCGLCLPHCPTHRLTGDEMYSPRGRLFAISAVAHGTAEIDAAYDDALSTCLGCRACEAVCPGLVPYGAIYETAIAELRTERPTVGRRLRTTLLSRVLPWKPSSQLAASGVRLVRRLRISWALPAPLRRGMAGLRELRPGRRPWLGRIVEPTGTARGSVGLLAGCVMDAWFGPVHDATVAVLQHAGYRVVVPEAQTCCGALAAHDGQVTEARRLAAANVAAFARADVIISNAAGCSAHLKEYGHWAPGSDGFPARVHDVTEFVAGLIDEGILPTFQPTRGDVAIQDPCHLRHAQRITSQPRAILRAAGHRVVEIDPDGLCCGAAGVYALLHPDTSNELGRQKASQIETSGAMIVASANPGCEMQLRAHVRPGTRIAHPVELYWEALADSLAGS